MHRDLTMKISASAGTLAGAFDLAASLCDARARKHAELDAIRLSASDGIAVTANVLDHSLHFSLLPFPFVSIADGGVVAVPGGRLAALVAGFPSDATVEIAVEESFARVLCAKSRYKLPTFPLDQIPAPLAIDTKKKKGEVTLSRTDILRLFATTLFAASTAETRYYLNGVLLRDVPGGLSGVATDGHRLVQVIVPGAALGGDAIVPNGAVEIILKLAKDKSTTELTLRRSDTLFEVAGGAFVFTSKLIDGVYPDVSRVIPTPSGNGVDVCRDELLRAVRRVVAVAGKDTKAIPLVGLEWDVADPAVLHLSLAGWDVADDVVEASMVTGMSWVAVNAAYFAEHLDEFAGTRIRLDQRDPRAPVLLNNPEDAAYTGLLMPCIWPGAQAKAA